MGLQMPKLYYSWPDPEYDAVDPDIQHFLDHVTEAWRPVRATMLKRVKFTNMNRSQSHTGDDYMSQLKYTVLVCNFTNSKERIKDQFIKGMNNHKYQKEYLKVTSDSTPLDELAKVVCKLEAVKLSTNALKNLSTHIHSIDSTITFTVEGTQGNGAIPFLDTLVASQADNFPLHYSVPQAHTY